MHWNEIFNLLRCKVERVLKAVSVFTNPFSSSFEDNVLYFLSFCVTAKPGKAKDLIEADDIGRKAVADFIEVSKGAKIRNRYNQVPHLTHDTNGKMTNSQLDTTNESQEVSPFPAGDHKAHINRHAQKHSKHKTEQKHKISTKEVPPWNGH